MTSGKGIAKRRKQKEWTQSQLAKKAGLSRGYVAAIEQGRRRPSLKTLVIIAKALEVDVRGLKEDI